MLRGNSETAKVPPAVSNVRREPTADLHELVSVDSRRQPMTAKITLDTEEGSNASAPPERQSAESQRTSYSPLRLDAVVSLASCTSQYHATGDDSEQQPGSTFTPKRS
jgi:hypothetical protein